MKSPVNGFKTLRQLWLPEPYRQTYGSKVIGYTNLTFTVINRDLPTVLDTNQVLSVLYHCITVTTINHSSDESHVINQSCSSYKEAAQCQSHKH